MIRATTILVVVNLAQGEVPGLTVVTATDHNHRELEFTVSASTAPRLGQKINMTLEYGDA